MRLKNQVGHVPVLDFLCPVRELPLHHRKVFGSIEGDLAMRLKKVGFEKLLPIFCRVTQLDLAFAKCVEG